MAALTFFKDLYGLKSVVWNFHESYHGKGAHDGIGAVLKYNVWRKVLRYHSVVKTAKDFYYTAQSFTTEKTELIYVSHEEIDSTKSTYKTIWENCKAAKQIQTCHQVKVLSHYKIALYHNSHDETPFAI